MMRNIFLCFLLLVFLTPSFSFSANGSEEMTFRENIVWINIHKKAIVEIIKEWISEIDLK